jgi:hypothetical protein
MDQAMLAQPRRKCTTAVLIVGLLWLPACERGTPTTSPATAAKAPVDPVDTVCDQFLTTFQEQSREDLLALSASPLTDEMNADAFEHVSGAVRWLGALQSRELLAADKTVEGQRRRYALTFDKGMVELELSMAKDKIMGFQFDGDVWADAELGAEVQSYDEFKVYELAFTDPDGTRLPGYELNGVEVHFVVVVGGMLQMMNEHQVTVKAMVETKAGEKVFLRPVEIETRFPPNEEGIPRGEVKAHVKVGGPGEYVLALVVLDDVGHQRTEFRQPFTVR